MKRLIFVVSLLLLGIGCAAIKERVDNAKACLADPACIEEVQTARDKGQRIGGLFGGLVPIPAAGAVGSGVVGLLFALEALTRNRKKKEITPP